MDVADGLVTLCEAFWEETEKLDKNKRRVVRPFGAGEVMVSLLFKITLFRPYFLVIKGGGASSKNGLRPCHGPGFGSSFAGASRPHLVRGSLRRRRWVTTMDDGAAGG